jgi:hypothetical protein
LKSKSYGSTKDINTTPPKKDPSTNAQYTLPLPILNYLTITFNLIHSYFSSPVTCPTNIYKYYSPFPRDIFFGSHGTSFQYQWKGLGLTHPHTNHDTQQAIHWARLVAHSNPHNITILITTDTQWYQNQTPHANPFLDTHFIAHFPLDTISYEESTIPPFHTIEPRIELNTLNIYCILNKQLPINSQYQLASFEHILNTILKSNVHLQTIPPIPPDIHVNANKTWNTTSHPPSNATSNSHPNFHRCIATILMALLTHPNKKKMEHGEENEQDTTSTALVKIYKFQNDCQVCKISSEPNY